MFICTFVYMYLRRFVFELQAINILKIYNNNKQNLEKQTWPIIDSFMLIVSINLLVFSYQVSYPRFVWKKRIQALTDILFMAGGWSCVFFSIIYFKAIVAPTTVKMFANGFWNADVNN